jgi:chemotaxis protein MotA
MERMANEEKEYLMVIKQAIVSFIGGGAPAMAVEFARRTIPPHMRPSFSELEAKLKERK